MKETQNIFLIIVVVALAITVLVVFLQPNYTISPRFTVVGDEVKAKCKGDIKCCTETGCRLIPCKIKDSICGADCPQGYTYDKDDAAHQCRLEPVQQ